MAERCFRKEDSNPPLCGVHNVLLVLKQLPFEFIAAGYKGFTFLVCPKSGDVLNYEATHSQLARNAPMKAVEYWVYENYPNNRAVGHMSTCSYFKLHGGRAPKTGKWRGPFDSRLAATNAGKGTGRPFHWCQRC
jgi:hypothetical protein